MKEIFLFISTFLFLAVNAQSEHSFKVKNTEQFPTENIQLHYNNELLITGETLYYKIYCFNQNNDFSEYSKIAYLELLSPKNETIIKQKIKLESGIGFGDLFINTNIKTGVYKLICYTNWMKNYNNYFEENVFVVNPFSNDIITKNNTSIDYKINRHSSSKSKISITNKSNYNKREKVILDLNKLNLSSKEHLSISVKRKNNINLPLKNEQKAKFKNQLNNNIKFLPELRGNLIQGKIVSKKGSNVTNKSVSLSINNNHLPLMATTNHNGEFYFNIPYLNTDKIYLQILVPNASEYEIITANDTKTKVNSEFPKIDLSQHIVNAIKDRTIYAQIKNAYYEVKKDTTSSFNTNDILLDKRKTTYVLDDYKRFKSLRETFVEIITKARIRSQNKKYRIIVPSEDIKTTGFIGNIPSLLIVDGHIVFDHDQFMDFDCSKINKISIVNRKYCYGNSIYQGITFIDTFKKDFIPTDNIKQVSVMNIQPKKEYYFENYNTSSKNRIPDFRTQLYWNPNIDSKKKINFYTSDVSGNYEIIIEGYSNSGKSIRFTHEFSVK
ncbi:hypothetical protein [uncultured Tenacibaculum sp.]|uniref:hypothetical protein n=1 Tax=uncultured Tenacibaculum sp. TaxID=174713 RepID=UPI0026278E0C|nr:hypothetical protein [uncultured Tenacibaculum sp.]